MSAFIRHTLTLMALSTGAACSWLAVAAHAQGPRAALVAVSPAVEREVISGQTFVGTVMPLRTATVGSAVDGRVIEFPVEAGDRVERGQTLAQLLTETIQHELAMAEAELELRKQALAELENGTRPEEIEQARARMVAAQARWQYATARRNRADRLFGAGQAMSEEERDEMIALAVEAEQAFYDARAAHQLATQGPRQEQIGQARAQVAMQAAAVDRLKDQIAKHTIISRFAGYVTMEHTEVGAWVKQGDPVAEIVALDEVDVVAQVVEQYVPYLRVGMEVTVQIPALPTAQLTGVVAAVVPQADVQARTFPVKVRVKNQFVDEQPVVKSGMYARVMLPTGARQIATLVSKDALVLGGAQPLVFVVDADSADAKTGKARPVPVQLGMADGNMIQVTGAIQPGQSVVVQGNERLQPGMAVQIQRVIQPAEAATQSTAGETS